MHLLILGGSHDQPGGLEAFAERSMMALSVHGDWKMVYLPTSTAYMTLERLPRLFRGWKALVKYRRQRPDIVWLQFVNLPDLSYLALARLLGMPVIVTPHLGSNWKSQSRPILRALSDWLLGFSSRMALISKTQEIEINFPAAVPRSYIRTMLPRAALSDVLAPVDLPSTLQLVHSCRLSEGKGTFLFVEVCARLRATGVPFYARIAGGADDATFAKLHALIAKYQLGDRIAVLGRLAEPELLDTLRASDVLVHLSHIDSYPLIVLEAMTCATIPVCLELAGARDMIETYDGHIVSAADAVEATATYLATQDLANLRRRGQAVAARVRDDYAWEHCAGILEAALTATISPA